MNNFEGKSKNTVKIIAVAAAVVVVIAAILFFALKDRPEIGEKSTDEQTTVEQTTVEVTTEAANADVTEEKETTTDTTETKVKEKTTKERTTQKTSKEKSPYDKLLDKYRKAVKDYKSGKGLTYDAHLANDDVFFGGDIKYAYVDINGDSIKELIVSSNECVVNIWKLVDGEMKPLFKDSCFGRRADVNLCQGGVLQVMVYYGRTNECGFYKIENIDYDPVLFDCVVRYGSFDESEEPVYARFDEQAPSDVSEVSDKNIITKAEYERALDEYKSVAGINWKKL